jgi:predicted RNA-binding Zn ribbon-like protein
MPTAGPYRSYAESPPQLIGGALCLDFINTVQWRGDRAAPGERLVRYEELAHWAKHAGVLGAPAMRRLLAEARRRPKAAQLVLDRAIALREGLARLAAPRRRRAAADLALVNDMLAAAPTRATMVPAERGFAWSAGKAEDALEHPLWAVVWSAAELLTSARLDEVRMCADPRCGWMFIDASRNRRRRWCAMENCGNRAKVRRHYERRRRAARAADARSE